MAIKAEPSFSLADQLFNEQSVGTFAKAMKTAHPRFDAAGFKRRCLSAFPDLELKQRISHMVDELEGQLPDTYDRALEVLTAALPAPLDPTKTDDDFGHFIWSVPAEWAARHGCTEQRLDRTLNFLREATMRFSVENAIRPFLHQFPKQTMAFMTACSRDDNYHVRRLASEGIRPYLPWAQRVRLPYDDIVTVLDTLHADPTRYVTRSVANTLNDLSRDDPALVVRTLSTWQRQGRQAPKELDWITRHSLRTLVRNDHREALELLGYPSAPEFSLSRVMVPPTVTVGGALRWQGTLKSKAEQRLKIGLRVHFLRANGSHSTKLFAVKDLEVGVSSLPLEKQIAFKPITTRTLYPGTHYIELVVNGKTRGKRAFELIVP